MTRPRVDLSPRGLLPCELDRIALEATQGPAHEHDAPHWLRRLAWAAVGLAVLAWIASACGCCGVTTTEHRAFVQASRRFYDGALPDLEEALDAKLATGKIHPQSAKNRREWLTDYGLALSEAEKRSAEK